RSESQKQNNQNRGRPVRCRGSLLGGIGQAVTDMTVGRGAAVIAEMRSIRDLSSTERASHSATPPSRWCCSWPNFRYINRLYRPASRLSIRRIRRELVQGSGKPSRFGGFAAAGGLKSQDNRPERERSQSCPTLRLRGLKRPPIPRSSS